LNIFECHFFLTLTFDETSSLQWEEIINIEKIAKQIHTSLDWKDCLVKCVVLFHSKVDRFMQLLLSSHHLLGNIKQHVENDIERITNKIIAFVPIIFNSNKNEFIEPTNAM
jgi:hypothetical protein